MEASSFSCVFAGATTKSITKCEVDKNTDMLQIGRSAEPQVDFIVMDTVPGEETISEKFASRSTISRFACRVLVDRNPPHTVRIFAGAFDSKNCIQIGVSACISMRESHASHLSCFSISLALL